MSALHTLRTAARRRALLRREGRRAPDPDPAAFLASWREGLGRLPPGVVERHALVAVPVDVPPWTDTGLYLAAGDRVTIFGAGRAFVSRALDLWTRPQ